MSIAIDVSIAIACPPETVFDVLADFSRNPEWQAGMVACRWRTEAPHGAGSVYEQEARFMGRAITTVFEVTHLEPGREIAIASRESTFPIQVTRRVEPDGEGGSVVSAHVAGDPSGVFKLAAPLMRRMVKKSVEKDYRALKAMLER